MRYSSRFDELLLKVITYLEPLVKLAYELLHWGCLRARGFITCTVLVPKLAFLQPDARLCAFNRPE